MCLSLFPRLFEVESTVDVVMVPALDRSAAFFLKCWVLVLKIQTHFYTFSCQHGFMFSFVQYDACTCMGSHVVSLHGSPVCV